MIDSFMGDGARAAFGFRVSATHSGQAALRDLCCRRAISATEGTDQG
jgi:hypothetical protein